MHWMCACPWAPIREQGCVSGARGLHAPGLPQREAALRLEAVRAAVEQALHWQLSDQAADLRARLGRPTVAIGGPLEAGSELGAAQPTEQGHKMPKHSS